MSESANDGSVMMVNEAAADAIVAGTEDPVTRNLVLFGIAEARRRFMRESAVDDDLLNLPVESFDLGFYASVLASMFAKRGIIERVLSGEDLAQASDWDV